MKFKRVGFLIITSSTILVTLSIIISGFIISLNISYQYKFIQDSLKHVKSEKLFSQVMRTENHYFFQDTGENWLTLGSVSMYLMELGVNIRTDDIRTFLGSELPGLSAYDYEIAVAGEGTDISTLPLESSPPTDVLLKERDVVEDELQNKGHEEDSTIKNSPEIQNKTVFIYQTHSWESYLPLLRGAKVPDDAISNDNRVNVVALGSRLSNKLNEKGIGTEHDQTNMTRELNKRQWKSTKSYSMSGAIIEANANKNGKLEYFIDIHRDSSRKDITTKTLNGKDYAKLFFVVGKGNEKYEKNLQFVKKLNTELEKRYPGISRGIFLKPNSMGNGVYNQNISEKAILIEVGGVDNDFEELDRSIDAFSEVFSYIYWKENEAKEVNGQ
ncbi:stage II sporulation protein P [Peribacillus sp. FSL E2-0218]|uniref:stage II sporulation protein P n=1 Tax=Peribacillus sp. FSL E2-0218 TaxID=2921364 RepID=UPI0030ED105A